jgi:hypothetical protein
MVDPGIPMMYWNENTILHLPASSSAFRRAIRRRWPSTSVRSCAAPHTRPGFPQHHRIAYHPLAKQLVVEYQLPDREVVPQYSEYRYVKVRDAIEPKRKKDPEIQELYERVVAQVALRTLHELFAVEAAELVFNGHVPATNRRPASHPM